MTLFVKLFKFHIFKAQAKVGYLFNISRKQSNQGGAQSAACLLIQTFTKSRCILDRPSGNERSEVRFSPPAEAKTTIAQCLQ